MRCTMVVLMDPLSFDASVIHCIKLTATVTMFLLGVGDQLHLILSTSYSVIIDAITDVFSPRPRRQLQVSSFHVAAFCTIVKLISYYSNLHSVYVGVEAVRTALSYLKTPFSPSAPATFIEHHHLQAFAPHPFIHS